MLLVGAGKGKALPPRTAGTAARDLRQTVDQEEVVIPVADVVPQIGRQGQDGHPGGPAFAGFVGSVIEPLLDDFLRCGPGLPQCGNGFGI